MSIKAHKMRWHAQWDVRRTFLRLQREVAYEVVYFAFPAILGMEKIDGHAAIWL
jgi:hypothetical protein